MKRSVGSKQMILVLLSLILAVLFAGCGGDTDKGKPEGLLLSLSFDEGSGNQISDGVGAVETATVAYNFTDAAYMENRDPEWRTEGVQGGCLLFDGNSNYVSYAPEELLVQGEALTVSVWVAPPGLRVGRPQRRRHWHGEPDCHRGAVQQGQEAGLHPGL